jgi:hypothetical protein
MVSISSSNSLDFSKFYELSDPLANRPLRLRTTTESEWLSAEDAAALARGRFRLDTSLKLEASMGGQATDFLWSELVHIVCISSHVVDLLTAHRCSGWSTYPVEVYDRKGNLLPDYHGFAVTGPECQRDKSRSKIVEKPPPAPRGRSYKVYKGLYFDESCWDGNDFFWVRPFGGMIITEKVYRLFKKHKVRNVRMIPLPEVERDVILDQYEKS